MYEILALTYWARFQLSFNSLSTHFQPTLTSRWDIICAIIKQRNPKYGKWVARPVEKGEAPHSQAEKKVGKEEINILTF